MNEKVEVDVLLTAALKRTRFLYKDFFYILDEVSLKDDKKFTQNVSISSETIWGELVKYYKKHRYSLDSYVDMSRATSRIGAFWHWRQHKKIYEFDEDLANMLMDQDIGNLVIDKTFFFRLPFNGLCMYISSSKYQMNQCIIVYTDWIDGNLALNFSVFSVPHLITEYSNQIDPRSMICCTEYRVKLIQDETLENVIKSVSGPHDIGYRIHCMKMVNLLMYILAANSDIIYKGSHIPKLNIIYTDDEPCYVERVSVGKNVGKIIRQWNEEYEEEVRKQRELDPDKVYIRKRPKGFKVPHMRAGHWHHYWCKNQNGELELVAHWLDPIFINKISRSTESARTNTSQVTK